MAEAETPSGSGADGHAITSFLSLFRSYGTAVGALVAATPLFTSGFDLLPLYEADRAMLSFFGTFTAVLGAAALFSYRHEIGARVFPTRDRPLLPDEASIRTLYSMLVPGGAVLLSVVALVAWQGLTQWSVEEVALEYATVADEGASEERETEAPEGEPAENGQEEKSKAPSETLKQALAAAAEGLHRPAGAEGRFVATTTLDAKLPWGEEEEKEALQGTVSKTFPSDGGEPQLSTGVRFFSQGGIDLVLDETPSLNIPWRWGILLAYVLMFALGTAAFVWLGLMEFAQETLGLDDSELMSSPFRKAAEHDFLLPGRVVSSDPSEDGDRANLVFRLYLKVAEGRVELLRGPLGPICLEHNRAVRWAGSDANGTTWSCERPKEGGKSGETETHYLTLSSKPGEGPRSNLDVMKEARQVASRELDELVRLYAPRELKPPAARRPDRAA